MNKTTIWQRMGAMLMALVLVLGMLPVSARAAEEGWAIGDASRLSVQLIRRGTAGNYQYEVSFVTDNVAQNDAAYYWCDDLSEAAGLQSDDEIYAAYRERTGSGTEEDPYKYTFDTTRATHTSANEDVGLKVVVDGLWVKVTIPEGAAQVDLDTDLTDDVQDMGWRYTATWATESTLPETVQVGVPFNVTWEYKCVEEQGTGLDGKYMSCGVEAAAVTFNDTWNAEVQTLEDGRYLLPQRPAGNLVLTRTVNAGMGGVKRGTETRTASAADTVFEDIQFNDAAAEAEKTTYVNSEDITISVKCGVEDAAYMPELAEGITWEKGEEAGVWTAKVPAGTYTIGGKTYTVAADTVALKFKDTPKAYVDGGKTYVEFALEEEPKSGIKSVLLGTHTAEQQTDGKWVIAEVLNGQADLTVTSNVGSEVSQSVNVIPALTVSVALGAEPDEAGYIGVDELKVEASRDGVLKIGEDEKAITAGSQTIKGDVAKYSEMSWTYTDDLGRVVTGTLGAYKVDTEAPVITIPKDELSGFRAEDTTITVSVADAGSGVASAEVKYTLDDDAGEQTAVLNESNEASIVLTNEQTLKKISVSAVDKMGNKAEDSWSGSLTVDTTNPEIALSISAATDGTANAITGTFVKGGNVWLVLESPVESQAEASTTFSIHATATDNLGMANMTDWTNEDGVWTKDIAVATVANHTEGSITLSVPVVKDNAGNYPESLDLDISKNQSLTLELNGEGTAYEAVVYIDRRYPGDGVGIPTVSFETDATPKATLEGDVKLYNEENLIFNVEVKDNGSGLAYATLSLDQDNNLNFLNGTTESNAGKYTITLASVEKVEGENNQLKLILTVNDYVNNKYTYHHIFAFDNQAPRMTFEFDKEYNHVEGGAYYFNEDVTATVTVEELNFVSDNTVVDQTGGTLKQNGQVYTVTFDTEGEKKLAVSSTDLAGNENIGKTHDIGETFIVDKGAPVIKVMQTTKDTNGAKDNGDTHYYNDTVTYEFTITDDNLSNDGGSVEIEYTINDVTTTKTLSDLVANEDDTEYTYSFTLEDGQTLTALSVYAQDNAGNLSAENGSVDIGTVVVDTTAPIVTITKNAEPVNTSVEHFDLYNGAVTYSISVADANLDTESTGAKYTGNYTYTNADGSAPESAPQIVWENPYEGTFTVEDGQRLTNVILNIADAAGNVPVEMADEQWSAAGDSITYRGNDVVVDTTAPEAELSFVSNTAGVELEGYYTNSGKTYLAINADEAATETMEIQAILKIVDRNLSVMEEYKYYLHSMGWEVVGDDTPATYINEDVTMSFVKKLTFVVNEAKSEDLEFLVQDLAGNLLMKENTTVALINGTMSGDDFINIDETTGMLTGTITYDRRKLAGTDTEIPTINLKTDAEVVYTTIDGTEVYDSKNIPAYDLSVNDGAEDKDKENSGLKSVKSESVTKNFLDVDVVANEMNEVETREDDNVKFDEEVTFGERYVQSYEDVIKVAQNGDALGEQNDASITVTAVDNEGNGITYQEIFGVDILAPRVTVTCDNDDVRNENYSEEEKGFFNKARVATITVTDINFDAEKTQVETTGGSFSGWTSNADGSVHTATVSYTTDGTYSLSMEVWDLAGNVTPDAKVTYEMRQPKNFVVDMKNPTILVTQTTDDKDVASNGNTHYYNETVTYSFTIADKHLTVGAGSAEIKYTINGTETSLALKDLTANEDNTSYTHSFTLTDGQTLTALSVDAKDNALNGFELNTSSNVAFDEDGKFLGGTIVVDTTAPEVTITKDSETPVNTVDNVDLYDGAVTYTISVKDAHLDPQSTGAKYAGKYTYTNAAGEAFADVATGAWTMSNEGAYESSFTVANGQRFVDAMVEIMDAAGNEPEAAGSDQWKIEEGIISYNSNDVVVDTIDPEAVLSFESLTAGVNLEAYYTNNGVAYLKISEPTTTETLDEIPEEIQVKAILTITDRNLSTKNGVTNALVDNAGWTFDADYTAINTDTASVTYTRTLTVKTNATEAVAMDFQIQDLVNHLLTEENASVAAINETTLDKFFTVEGGKLTGTITLDRRQPTSGNDTDIPEITETITPDSVAEVDGTPLYNADQLNIALDVHDGEPGADENEEAEKDKENSGLHEVTWEIIADDFITGGDGAWPGEDEEPVYQRSITRDVVLSVGEGEQNDVTFHVTAEDNVGNHITHEKIFAVDTMAPRVTVTCDNNDVRNEGYSDTQQGFFNKTRVVTITVEELNFDTENTTVETTGGDFSGWTSDGTTHTATVSYTTDGTYSLSMVVKDLAGNTTEDADVNYDGMICPKDFVVDLTMPEIRVTYNPADESGAFNGVLFYNELQNVTVTIDELNFDVQGVATEFTRGGAPSGHQLSEFTADDISNSAHVAFDNGNNYKFTIEFEDLAGNEAEAYTSPTFSVDTNAPEIKIIETNIEQDLQPLGNELELVLQVTDEESNLAEYNLVLTHVNNAFEKTVVSGDVYYVDSGASEESVTITFRDFPYEKLYDGIYTVELEARDYANNKSTLEKPITFSMNRFGSTFVYGDEFTQNFLTAGDDGVAYHNSVDGNLVIQEINPTRVYTDDSKKQEGSSVTMVVNGQSTLLVQGKHYKLTVEEFGAEGSKWYVYTYEIFPDVFADGKDLVNGRYSIVLYGVDEAGNNNTNTLETVDGEQAYTAKLEFVLDTIAPVIITTGIESGEIYDAANKQMEIEIADSTPCTIQVSVNGQVVSLSSKNDVLPEDSIWLVQDEATGIYTLNVTEQNTLFGAQQVQIKALDAADNAAEAEVTDFTITTNWFVRYVNSGWLMITLAGLAALILLLVVVSKKKKKVAA